MKRVKKQILRFLTRRGVLSKKAPLTKVFPGQGRGPFRKLNKLRTERNKFEPLSCFNSMDYTFKVPKGFKGHEGLDPQGIGQKDYLIHKGLGSTHVVVDIGCGDLRAGVPLIRYLDDGCYIGIDQSSSALYQGSLSLSAEDRLKNPRFFIGGEFGLEKLDIHADYCWANSVFTHIDLSLVAKCMASAFHVLKPGGVFLATYFRPVGFASWIEPEIYRDAVQGKYEEKYTYSYRNPFHHKPEALKWLAEDIGFEVTILEDVTPKKQHVLQMVKPVLDRTPGN